MNPPLPPLPPCAPGGPELGCCVVAVPDVSGWQVVCASGTQAPDSIPTLTLWGGLLLGLALVGAACWRLR